MKNGNHMENGNGIDFMELLYGMLMNRQTGGELPGYPMEVSNWEIIDGWKPGP
jgi:hypothetical protein